MAGISSKAAGSIENKKKFIGQEFAHDEFSDGSGLDIYEFKYRMHDPQTGRFLQVDPLASDYVYNTPYAYAENKLGMGFDLEGLELALFNDAAQWLVNKTIRNPNGAAATTLGVVAGVGNFAQSTVTGAANLVTNPPNITPQGTAEGGVQLGLEVFNRINTIQNGSTVEKSAAITETVLDAISIVAGTKGVGSALKTESSISKITMGFSDNATVVRGGTNTADLIKKGTGTHPEGIAGVSVECGTCSVKDLAKPLPHSQIGVTTVGDVRNAGGDVIKTSGKSPNHATMTGLSPEQASDLLRPTIKNPNKP